MDGGKMPLIRVLTGFLFMLLLAYGALIASHRILWNDEYYSLFSSTLGASYKTMLMKGVGEGNNSPLFYVLQKALCDLFSYHPPEEWLKHWSGAHIFDQFFLRIQPVVFMSVALSALFYYFSRRNSLLVGAYALGVAMTSILFWFHWTEARPYAGWFALSLFQILFLLNILEGPVDQYKRTLACLCLVHCLLALISNLSVVQIFSATAVLSVFHRPRLLWYIFLALLPLGICSFYYVHAPHYDFFFVDGPLALINASVPKDRLFIIFLSAAVLFVRCRGKGWMARLEIKYLTYFLLILGAFGVLLLKLKYGGAGTGGGFQVSSRYFLSLVPAGIVGTVLFSVYLIQAFPSKVWRFAAVIFLAGLLIFRFHKTEQLTPKSLYLVLCRPNFSNLC